MSDTEDIVVIESYPCAPPDVIEAPEYERGAHGTRTSLPRTDQRMDYQMQLLLLEQQNKKRLLMARQEQDDLLRGSSAPLSPPTINKNTARGVHEPPVATFPPPPPSQTSSERRVTPCPPGAASPRVSKKTVPPEEHIGLSQGTPLPSRVLEDRSGEEDTADSNKDDPSLLAPPPECEPFWPSVPPPQFQACSPLPPKGFPGPLPPPPPPGVSYRMPQRVSCYPPPPPPPMPFHHPVMNPCILPPGFKMGKKKAKSFGARHLLPVRLSTYSARKNHEAVHYRVGAKRHGKVRDRYDSDMGSVASWNDSDSEASDSEFDSSDRVVKISSYRALLRYGDDSRDITVRLEPFGRNVYVTSHPAAVVDFKKFLPFLKHANLDCWYIYPTAHWFKRASVLEEAGCEITSLVPVDRATPAALDCPTIVVTAALTSSLEDEIGECDVDPDTSECDMRAHRTLPPHKSLKSARNELAYYSIVSTFEDKIDPYGVSPMIAQLSRDTTIFKVVKMGSREAAASQAFWNAGAKGWSTVFTCAVKEDAELVKIKDHEFVRAEQCSEVVGSGGSKQGQKEKVFY
ncbi:hypothetical protein H2199_008247 [Coniosporium tulheliwenetii]|uniref:Uncharacterized protein n=1 Tax=Coniosporium tulheliwenetii TaxID=3383036 RepID=A0ACC2YL99_9PEZI|nr:hypothetical protein H2199_008247 [Cladosporium sp. JES 115]